MLESDGNDIRRLSLAMRETNLAKLLRRLSGIFLSDFEQWEIGPPRLQLGLEGLVSKHRQRANRAGRAEHWGKVKNPGIRLLLGDGGVWEVSEHLRDFSFGQIAARVIFALAVTALVGASALLTLRRVFKV